MVEQDKRREDDWFRENERHLLEAAKTAREKREKERAAKEAEAERTRLRETHFMKCPKCGHDLREEDLLAVKVDRCTFCEGIFLDAGEIEQVFLKRDLDRKGFFRKLLKV